MTANEWVKCPICGEGDMRKTTDDEGYSLIHCVNHACASNGGTAGASPAQPAQQGELEALPASVQAARERLDATKAALPSFTQKLALDERQRLIERVSDLEMQLSARSAPRPALTDADQKIIDAARNLVDARGRFTVADALEQLERAVREGGGK